MGMIRRESDLGCSAWQDRSRGGKAMKMRRKSELPTKVCAACGRPFAWRKKWEKVWDEVRYCSERCKRSRKGMNAPAEQS
ncbi:MAG: DUF2256 domain-containing protein [Roseovarius sp.]